MQFWTNQDYQLGYVQENLEFFMYSLFSFLVPFLIGRPQWLIGIIVNSSLILAGLNLRDYKMLPIIFLPSIAVVARGIIFGPFTVFSFYIIPAIWIGNAVLVFCFKSFRNRWISLGLGALLKTSILFGSAYILVKFSVLPTIFLITLGILQLYTAVAGGLLAFGVHSLKKKLNSR